MSIPLEPYPELAGTVMLGIVAQFPDQFADATVGTETIERVGRELPPEGPLVAGRFARVRGLGGPDGLITALGVVDVEVFAPTFSEGWDLAQALHQWIIRYPHRIDTGARFVVIDRVTTSLSPQEVDWEPDSRVRRFMSSYQISARR